MDTANSNALPAAGDSGLPYRVAPHNIDAEMALLGAILVNNEAHNKVGGFLRPGHFFDPVHGRIFDAAATLIERGQLANPLTLKAYFEHDEALAEIGGAHYLVRLATEAATVINAEDYGKIIYDMSLRRELIRLGEDMVNSAYEPNVQEEALSQIESAEHALYGLAEQGQIEGGFQEFRHTLQLSLEQAQAAHKREGKLTGVTTGLRDLDQKLGGLHRSDLLILAGRPSMGKTALATNMAFNAAKARRRTLEEQGDPDKDAGATVGFFSLEMSAEQLATRILAEESGISSEKVRRGEFSNDDFANKLAPAVQYLEDTPFFIDDTPALTITALRTRARRLKRTHGLGLLVVDYLQLLRPSGNSRTDNRVLEISEITRGLKAIAKELDIPVLALSQLSRQVENREDKRPQLSDLRESGSIEQDADVVMFVFREEYYEQRKEPTIGTPEYASWQERMERVHNLAEVIIGKQRHGPVGTVKLMFQAELTKFGDLDRTDHLPEAF